MSDLKKTPFYDKHVELAARMVEFGGWSMPVQYRSILDEHHHTRTEVSLFDCSHMGQFRITGKNAGAALDAIFPRTVGDQPNGSCRYNFLLNENGGVIDDLIVYRIAADEYFIVVNAGTKDGDAACIRKYLDGKADFSDESEQTAKLDLQGPKVMKLMPKLGLNPAELPDYFNFFQTKVGDVDMIVSQTGYTGERGFEFYFDAAAADRIWDLMLSLDEDVKPAGLGSRDTLRLEMGYPLYGHELDAATTPVEAGMKRMLTLDHEFIGRDGVLAERRKRLIGITLEGRRAAREHATVCDSDGNEIGEVTSGSFGPSVGAAIAMAYVKPKTVKTGDSVQIDAGRATLNGTVVKRPFYNEGTAGK